MSDTPTFTEDVAPDPLPGAQLPPNPLTPNTTGENINQAVEQTGMVGLRVGFDAGAAQQALQQKASDVAALGASTTVEGLDLQGLHGPKGLMTTDAGPNAQTAADAFMAKRQQQISTIRQGLPTPQAQQSFDAHLREQNLQVQGKLDGWVKDQGDRYDGQVISAKLANTEDAAVVASVTAKTPQERSQQVNEQITQGSAAIMDRLHRMGVDPSTPDGHQIYEHQLGQYTSGVLERSITAMVDGGDDQGAKAMLDEHRTDLGDRAGPVSRLVDRAAFQGDVRRNSQAIALGPDGKAKSWGDIQDAIDNDPRAQKDPDYRDAVTSAAGRIASGQNRVQVKALQDMRNQALGLLQDPTNRNGIDDPRMMALQDKMGGPQSPYWQQVEAAADRQEKRNENRPSDPKTFTDNVRMLTDPARLNEARTHDFQADYANGLISYKDFQHQTEVQADLLKPDAGPKASQLRVEQEDFKLGMQRAGVDINTLHGYGLYPDDPSRGESWGKKTQLDMFQQQYQQRIDTMAQDPARAGKPLSSQERQDAVKQMLLDTVRVPGVLSDTVKPVSQLAPDEAAIAREPLDELRSRDPLAAGNLENGLRGKLGSAGIEWDKLSSRTQSWLAGQQLIREDARRRGDKATVEEVTARMNQRLQPLLGGTTDTRWSLIR